MSLKLNILLIANLFKNFRNESIIYFKKKNKNFWFYWKLKIIAKPTKKNCEKDCKSIIEIFQKKKKLKENYANIRDKDMSNADGERK